ncbi:MAG: hypothetical protein KIT84_29665 [Labilithrix sp.]|nr:hypothetical protein [Labilithrix sp.]MCW5815231.1 hypothetical protein [Labilithrix sp.]
MRRVVRLFVCPAALAFLVVSLAVACGDGAQGCRVDTDCPTGHICRGSLCDLANPEAGVIDAEIAPLDSSGTTCSGEGIFCSQPSECCSQICAEGRCATSPASTPLCRGLYELCTDDCCAGFTCNQGSCR